MYVQPEFDVVRSINKTASDKRDAAAIPSQLEESISDTRNWSNFCLKNEKSEFVWVLKNKWECLWRFEELCDIAWGTQLGLD